MGLIERCARALYGMAGEKWLENYPWESAEKPAVEARGMAMEQAKVALEAVNHQGAVEDLRVAVDLLSRSRCTDLGTDDKSWWSAQRKRLSAQWGR